jgi:hypothetical protein
MMNATETKKTAAKGSATKVVTGIVRLSYAHIWEPQTDDTTGRSRYSASLLIPKTDTVTVEKIQQAILAAYAEGKDKLRDKNHNVPPLDILKTPLRDGDKEKPGDETYAGTYFVNANSTTNAPEVLDLNREPITNHGKVYSGCYVRASISFYAFNTQGNRGIACGLNGIQLVREGKSLGGRTRAVDDFDDDFSTNYASNETEDFLA